MQDVQKKDTRALMMLRGKSRPDPTATLDRPLGDFRGLTIFLRRFTPYTLLAQSGVHETMLLLCEHAASVDMGQRAATWMVTMTYRQTYKALRHLQRMYPHSARAASISARRASPKSGCWFGHLAGCC